MESHVAHHHDNDTDNSIPNCGWRVLPEAPEASEGAGFYLQLCCQCVPPATDGGGAAARQTVITCVEYSSKFGMLVDHNLCSLYVCVLYPLCMYVYVCVCMYACT